MTYEVEQTEDFEEWLDGLRDSRAQKKIVTRIIRAEGGNLGEVETVGEGVSEMKIHYGPGYRLYFTMRDRKIVFLLWGGDKSTQTADIKKAHELAADA